MTRSSLLRFLPLAVFGFSLVAAPLPAAHASPLGRIHDRLFGGDDDKDRKKKKKKDDDDDDHRHHHHYSGEHKCWDLNQNGYCDADRCGRRMRVTYSEPRPYYRERTYVEPAPRVYVERRTYVETPRTYSSSSYSRSLEADVQLALRRRGYYHGPIDGDAGPGTRSAIRDYQYDRGLAPTGRIDRDLIRSLGL
jgi:hypothetical protein